MAGVIYQSGKALSQQKGTAHIQVKYKNFGKTIPLKQIRNSLLSLWEILMDTAGLQPKQDLVVFKIGYENPGPTGQAVS